MTSRPWIGSSAVAVVVGLLVGLLIPAFSPGYLVVAGLGVLSFAPVAYGFARERMLEEPVTFLGLSFMLFGALSALGAYLRGVDGYPHFYAAAALTGAGLLAAYLAYSVSGPLASAVAANFPDFSNAWNTRRLFLCLGVLCALGAIGLRARFLATGFSFFSDDGGGLPTALQTTKLGGINWSIPLLACPGVALVLLFAHAWTVGNRPARLLWFACAGCFAFIYAAVGSRSRLLFVLLPMLATWHFAIRPVRVRTIMALLLGVWGAYVIFGQFRGTLFGEEQISTDALVREGFAKDYLAEHGDMMEFRATAEVMEEYPARSPYLLGSTLVTPITNWVPRSVWPGKPASASAVYSARFLADAWERGGSAPPGLVGELYMNFGLLGVPLGMAFLGVALRILRAYRERNSRSTGVAVIYGSSLMYVAMAARGDVAFVGLSAEVSIGLLVATLWVVGARMPHGVRGAHA